MNKREAWALKRTEKKEEKLQRKYMKLSKAGRFKRWRNRRPFWGATLTVLAALVILYIPIHLYAIAFIPGSLVFVGFLFGGLLLIVGSFAYVYPQFSTVFGVISIFLSVLSVMGALGGFIVGSILGIIAGSLCIGWERREVVYQKNQQRKQGGGLKKVQSSDKEKQAQAAQA
ncbi:DUF6114 domain-containing protein [Virgibacillus phasianinus]|uniref:DUF6114 domain-containing protein n=1 Tax=Virgibacillus phasianinus TaxID=2017483 RepID=UPI001C12C936|nr:DUF6114 domain-containing protein [Virgibacillus phasianinus]